MWSQLGFQHNWSGRNFSKYESHSSRLSKRSQIILLRCARIKSSWNSPLVVSGLHANKCSRNHTCSSETQHSRCVDRVAFAIHKVLKVSARRAGTKVWPCSICSRKCNSLMSIFSGFLGKRTCPRTVSSKASIRVLPHSSRVVLKEGWLFS